MKKLFQPIRRAVLVFPLVLFCLLSLALAEKRISDSTKHPVRASDKLISISLTTYDNRVIMVSQYDGEMITTGPKEGELLGITPHLSDDGSVVLEFSRVIKIIRKGAVIGGAITNIGTMELNSALPQVIPTNLISRVQLVGVSKAVEESAVGIQARRQPCPCCVTCGGSETCGAGVVVECGSCTCD